MGIPYVGDAEEAQVRKRRFFAPFYTERKKWLVTLPRQARDKHGGS